MADESTQAYPDMSADTVLVPAPTVTVDGDEITIRQWMESNEALDAQGLVDDFYDRLTSDPEIAEETDALVRRDARDATQTVQASDAVLIDTTYLTQEDQVERIVALARAVTHRPDWTSPVDG